VIAMPDGCWGGAVCEGLLLSKLERDGE